MPRYLTKRGTTAFLWKTLLPLSSVKYASLACQFMFAGHCRVDTHKQHLKNDLIIKLLPKKEKKTERQNKTKHIT